LVRIYPSALWNNPGIKMALNSNVSAVVIVAVVYPGMFGFMMKRFLQLLKIWILMRSFLSNAISSTITLKVPV
jgi:hypothetical protein